MRGSRAASPRRRRRRRRTGSHNYFFISAAFNIGAKLEDSKTDDPLIETRRVEGINCRYSTFAQPFKRKKKKILLESHEDPSDTRLKKICIPFKRGQANSSKRRPPSRKLFNSWPSKLFYSLFFSSLHLQLFFFFHISLTCEKWFRLARINKLFDLLWLSERDFLDRIQRTTFILFRVIFLSFFFFFFFWASHKRMLNCWHDERHPTAQRGYIKCEDYWRVLA